MPPKPKHSKDEIIDTAVNIIRSDSITAITAQEIAKRLGTSTRPMFTYFSTVDELRTAAYRRAAQIYDSYVERGLQMMPPYKGYAMEHVKFAAEEPNLFRLLFMHSDENFGGYTFPDFGGHLDMIRNIIMEHFHLSKEQSDWLHLTLSYHAHGMASLCACGVMKYDEEKIASQFGEIFRALMIYTGVPKDKRTQIIPASGIEMPGGMEDYLLDFPTGEKG